jgi:hypothetical protein
MPCHAMHPMQDLFFGKFFTSTMIFICATICTKFLFLQKVGVTSSRLRVAPIIIPVVLWSLLLFYSIESRYSLYRYYLCNNNYILFVTFGYL